jgi:hypothetical protein
MKEWLLVLKAADAAERRHTLSRNYVADSPSFKNDRRRSQSVGFGGAPFFARLKTLVIRAVNFSAPIPLRARARLVLNVARVSGFIAAPHRRADRAAQPS